jgi:hypothetical protein
MWQTTNANALEFHSKRIMQRCKLQLSHACKAELGELKESA